METTRLKLIPFKPEYVAAAIESLAELEKVLGSRVAPEWPSRDYAKSLPVKKEKFLQNPERAKWSRIAIEKNENTVIGEIGCQGGPDADGALEISYGIVPAYRNQGYGTEMVEGFTDWLCRQPEVTEVAAGCRAINRSSARVLEKAGFRQTSQDNGIIYWKKSKAAKVVAD